MRHSSIVAGLILASGICACGSSPACQAPDTSNPSALVVDTLVGKGAPPDIAFGQIPEPCGAAGNAIADGDQASANIEYPTALAFDHTNNRLYFVDNGNAIRFVNLDDDSVATLTASNVATSCRISGLAVAPNGVYFSADRPCDQIGLVDPKTKHVTLIGIPEPDGGPPIIPSTDGGWPYQIPDAQFADGASANARFFSPQGIWFDPTRSTLYIADLFNHRIRALHGDQVTTVAGSSDGGFIDGSLNSAEFFRPSVLAGQDGSLFVADGTGQETEIRRLVTGSGGSLTTWVGSPSPQSGDGSAKSPGVGFLNILAMQSAADGSIYVLDESGLRHIDANGVVGTLSSLPEGFADGPLSKAQFYSPSGIALDCSGNIYISDSCNSRIRRVRNP